CEGPSQVCPFFSTTRLDSSCAAVDNPGSDRGRPFPITEQTREVRERAHGLLGVPHRRTAMPGDTPQELTFSLLHAAVAGPAAAARITPRLGPAGGDGDKVFPPTYKHPGKDASVYATETRRIDGREVHAVLLDSAASQANRMEEALLRAFERGECDIPVL